MDKGIRRRELLSCRLVLTEAKQRSRVIQSVDAIV